MTFSSFSPSQQQVSPMPVHYRALEKQPSFGQSSDLVRQRIDTLLEEKRYKPAVAYLRANISNNPNNNDARVELVRVLTDYGKELCEDRKFRTAIPLLEEAWQQCDALAESEACLHLLAQASAHAKQFRSAYQYAGILHTLDPNTPIYQLLDLIKERKL